MSSESEPAGTCVSADVPGSSNTSISNERSVPVRAGPTVEVIKSAFKAAIDRAKDAARQLLKQG